jgi:WD repeat-containing protein 23
LASNSKDQSLKLWDLRRATTSDEKASEARRRGGGFDYRFGLPEDVVDELVRPAADDLSIKTFRGHGVLETLIRCRFSPAWSTGQRYIYTGSHGGTVFVYDTLTGECVNRLIGHHRTVRDVHWHPFQPLIITSSWDGSVGMWKYHSVSAAGGPRQSSGRERAAAESPRMAAQSSTDEAGESELSDTDDEEEVARGAEGGAQEDGDEYEGEDSDV